MLAVTVGAADTALGDPPHDSTRPATRLYTTRHTTIHDPPHDSTLYDPPHDSTRLNTTHHTILRDPPHDSTRPFWTGHYSFKLCRCVVDRSALLCFLSRGPSCQFKHNRSLCVRSFLSPLSTSCPPRVSPRPSSQSPSTSTVDSVVEIVS